MIHRGEKHCALTDGTPVVLSTLTYRGQRSPDHFHFRYILRKLQNKLKTIKIKLKTNFRNIFHTDQSACRSEWVLQLTTRWRHRTVYSYVHLHLPFLNFPGVGWIKSYLISPLFKYIVQTSRLSYLYFYWFAWWTINREWLNTQRRIQKIKSVEI